MKNFTIVPRYGLDAWTQAQSRRQSVSPSRTAAAEPSPGVESSSSSILVEEREMTDEDRLIFGIYR